MKLRALLTIALVASLGSVGCSRSDSGSGSRTLLAQVEVQATGESTIIEAQVQLRGAPVAGATVVVRDPDGDRSVTLEGRAGGLYRGTLSGYARTLELVITSGADHLDATLEGPAAHVITRPPNDARVRRAGFATLRVEWDAEDVAEHVDVAVGATTASVEGDAWEADLPLAPISDGAHTVSVTRETSIDLAGGVAGSRMRSRYKVDNRFTLEG